MEKFKLNNGATIVIAECSSKELSVSVTVNVGHVNEPKLGIAALYENVLMKQVSRVQTVYGGTVTSFSPDVKRRTGDDHVEDGKPDQGSSSGKRSDSGRRVRHRGTYP